MKQKILISALTAVILASSLEANSEILGGDAGLACEAILCLSSPARPSECQRSLAKYFSIHFSKPWKTINARKQFLSLCPEGSMTPEMKQQVEDLSRLTGFCSVDELNANIEKKKVGTSQNSMGMTRVLYNYRISPEMTENCKIVTRMNYNDYAFKYTCNKEFYKEEDWNNGFIKEEISKSAYDMLSNDLRMIEKRRVQISYPEWNKLPNDEREAQKISGGDKNYYIYYKLENAYFKKNFIKKDCWVDARK